MYQLEYFNPSFEMSHDMSLCDDHIYILYVMMMFHCYIIHMEWKFWCESLLFYIPNICIKANVLRRKL